MTASSMEEARKPRHSSAARPLSEVLRRNPGEISEVSRYRRRHAFLVSRQLRRPRIGRSEARQGGFMSLSCPVGLDVSMLRREVDAVFGRVATTPKGEFHFHRGPEYAVSVLGYDGEALARLPVEVTARFAGIGNPLAVEPLNPGETVLDVGCGAGTDLLLAALSVAPQGAAIGVD